MSQKFSIFNIRTILLMFLLLLNTDLSGQAAITFGHSGGRFGDNLISYLHAKWVSYITGIPLLCNYRGFHYASSLKLFSEELDFEHFQYSERIVNFGGAGFILNPEKFICYNIPYFPEFESEYTSGSAFRKLFTVDWKDPEFREIALKMISPTIPLTLTLPPEGVLSVAIHVREGGNHDSENVRYTFPLKVPPLHFYVDALKELANLFKGRPMYGHIFTDAVDPSKIAEAIQNLLPSDLPIQINYRKSENHDRINVLDDFFSLYHYDMLIRPESNFSKVPELLHDFKVVVAPKHVVIIDGENGKVVQVDELDVNINNIYSFQLSAGTSI